MKLAGIEISNMYWANEFDYEPVAQVQMRTVTGAPVVFERSQKSGAPMTLTGGWAKRSIVKQLQDKRELAGQVFTLELGDREFEVMFDRSQQSIIATQLDGGFVDPSDNDRYEITLNMLLLAETTESD